MKTLTQFEAYWTELVDADPAIKRVIFIMDWEEITALQLSEEMYDCLVVEIPDMKLRKNGSVEYSFETAVSIVRGMGRELEPAVYRQALDELFVKLKDVLNKLDCDSEQEDLFDFQMDQDINPIIRATSDNCYGWRTYIKMSNY